MENIVAVYLTRGALAIVDADDADRVMDFKWCAVEHRGQLYASKRYRGDKAMVYLHRFVADAPEDLQVRFLNGCTLDCRTPSDCLVCLTNGVRARVLSDFTSDNAVLARKGGSKWPVLGGEGAGRRRVLTTHHSPLATHHSRLKKKATPEATGEVFPESPESVQR